jgi:uncharacterized protein (TIGR02001 family)
MKTQTRIALLGLVLLSPSAASHAQPTTNTDEPTIGVEVEADVVSTYYWRGFDVTDHEPALQPGFTLRHKPSGLWFNVWTCLALNNRQRSREADEIDLTLALDRPLGEPATLTLGFLHYRFPRVVPEENSTDELFAGIFFSELPLQPSIFYFHDFGLGDGGYLQVGGVHALGPLTLAADLGFSLAQYTDKKGFSDLVVGASYDIPVAGTGYLSPFVKFAVVDDRDRNPDRSEFWFGVAVGWER